MQEESAMNLFNKLRKGAVRDKKDGGFLSAPHNFFCTISNF